MNLTLIDGTSLGTEPVALADAKTNLEIASADTSHDTMISALITSARIMAENYCGREFFKKQYLLAMDSFPARCWSGQAAYPSPIWLPDPITWQFAVTPRAISLLDPLVSVDAFTYKDSTGATTAMVANTDYIVDIRKHPGIVTLPPNGSWPSASLWTSSAVQITFTAGPNSGGYVVPGGVKQGIMLLVTQWFENRVPFEAIRFVAQLPFSVSALFESERLYKF